MPDPTHVMACADGAVLSHAMWVTRWLAPGAGPPLRAAYIEAVATDPAYQGRGLATAVMRVLVSQLSSFQLAALCPSDRGQSLYARLGWEPWRGPLLIRQETHLIETPDEAVMIHRLPASPPLNLEQPLSAEWRPGELW